MGAVDQHVKSGAYLSLQLPPEKLEDLLARIPPPAASALSASNFSGGMEAAEAEGGKLVASRAVALLNLLARLDHSALSEPNKGKEDAKAMRMLRSAADANDDDMPIGAPEENPKEPDNKDTGIRNWSSRPRS